MPQYQFRPMSADDLPLLRDWLARPHVAEWWRDADEQFELVSGDLEHHDMDAVHRLDRRSVRSATCNATG